MATVRLTESLKDEILENAKKLFAKRMAEAEQHPPEYSDGDFIFDCYLDGNPKARDTLLAMQQLGWTEKSTDARASLFGRRMRLTFKKPRSIYSGWTSISGNACVNIAPTDHPALTELYNKLQQREVAVQTIKSEREAFVNQVGHILDNASTLKKAMSLWPGIWELVPQGARTKYYEVTTRSASADSDEPVEVDIESLNTAVVVSKIVEGVI
jgi:hypothetical protein